MDAFDDAVNTLLVEEDGHLVVAIRTNESLHDGMGGAGALVDWFTGLIGTFMRAIGQGDKAMIGGTTFAVTTTGVVILRNDQKRVPAKRVGRMNGYEKIGTQTNADLLQLEVDARLFRTQPSQREKIGRLIKFLATQ